MQRSSNSGSASSWSSGRTGGSVGVQVVVVSGAFVLANIWLRFGRSVVAGGCSVVLAVTVAEATLVVAADVVVVVVIVVACLLVVGALVVVVVGAVVVVVVGGCDRAATVVVGGCDVADAT